MADTQYHTTLYVKLHPQDQIATQLGCVGDLKSCLEFIFDQQRRGLEVCSVAIRKIRNGRDSEYVSSR